MRILDLLLNKYDIYIYIFVFDIKKRRKQEFFLMLSFCQRLLWLFSKKYLIKKYIKERIKKSENI